MNRHHKNKCCQDGFVLSTWSPSSGASTAICSVCALEGPSVSIRPCPNFPEANGILQSEIALALFWKMKRSMKRATK